jgi:hypothetical protein
MAPDERGRRAPTPAALASLSAVPEGYRVLPDPLHGQALLRVPARPCEVRVLLDRSFESAQAGEPTQDYMAIRCDPGRLTFAVTDGVGSSFLGDVAAQILAAHLTDWLAPRPRHTSAFDRELDADLRALSREVMDRVASWPLPASASGLVRSALDQQRAYGSEAMFACGAVDLTGRDAMVSVAWLGDAHVRVIMRDGRHMHHSGATTDRWSSRLGPRGAVQTRTWPAAEVARVMMCTDGLRPELDAVLELADDQLSARVAALAARPGNDDIALVDVGLVPRALPAGDPFPGSAPGRHARPTPAGSALRRFIRGGGQPPPPAPSQPATVVARAAVPVPLPRPSTVDDADAKEVVERFLGPEPPGSVRWHDHEVTWSPVDGADSYAVQICLEPTFAEPLLYAVPGVSFTVPRLPGPTYVRVRCIGGGEPGPWGLVHDLSVPPPATGTP